MAHYNKRVKMPPCRVEGTLINIHGAVLPLVEYYKKPPSWVFNLDTWDVITSLDIYYNKVLNEQHYHEYLEKRIKKVGKR